MNILGTLIERLRSYIPDNSLASDALDELEAALATLPSVYPAVGVCIDHAAFPPAPPQAQEQIAWLVELGSNPPQWWTGRGDEWTPHVDGTASVRGNGADSAIRFARREDAERAIGWLLNKDVARGCKVTEHLWLAASPPAQERCTSRTDVFGRCALSVWHSGLHENALGEQFLTIETAQRNHEYRERR